MRWIVAVNETIIFEGEIRMRRKKLTGKIPFEQAIVVPTVWDRTGVGL
jgi:hypothetical protein